MINCNVCGKNLTDPDDGMSLAAMVFSVITTNETTDKKATFMAEQMAPFLLNTDYYICYPCLFNSWGVKP